MMIARKLLVLAAALLALAGTAGCGVFSAPPRKLSAQFQDSVGLYAGNDVAVLGIKVGSVTRVQPSGRYVLVEMEIDPEVKVPANAGAVTLSPAVVTDRRVELTPVYRGGPTLADGAVIPLSRTRTPVEIDRVFAAADNLAGELTKDQGTPPAVAGALASVAEVARGNGERMNRAIQGLAGTVGVAADHRDQLVRLIQNGDHLAAVAARNDATIRSVTANLSQAAALFDQQGPNFVKIMHNLTDLVDRTDRLIEEHRPEIVHSVDNLRVTVGTLADRNRELAETVGQAPMLFQNMSRIADKERGAARVHVSIDQAILGTQLAQGFCLRFPLPVFCPTPAEGPSGQLAKLGALFLGGGAR